MTVTGLASWRRYPPFLVFQMLHSKRTIFFFLLHMCSWSLASPDIPLDHDTWMYLARQDPSLRPMAAASVKTKIGGGGWDHVEVVVEINTTRLSVTHQNREVYRVHGGARLTGGLQRPHSGIHLLVLEAKKGQVLLAEKFLTFVPSEHLDLAKTIDAIQPGRLLVVTGVPEWVMFLGKEGESSLRSLGFTWPPQVALGEPWVGVAITGGGVVVESATTAPLRQDPTNSLNVVAALKGNVFKEEACDWHSETHLSVQAKFCREYEGYGDLCVCNDPFTPALRYKQETLGVHEKIPVVVVTANKPHKLYRILHNLFSMPGAAETDFLVVVDDAHAETLALAETMKVDAIIHKPEGVHNERTNANIRFALYSVFAKFPLADKAIIFEDDLLLSPDILRFFHETAWLLDNDPSVFCVNAFNSNSLAGTASDTGTMLRSEGFPMYGWMVKRHYAMQAINNWIPKGWGDWDWWLGGSWPQRGRDVVSPEVSRAVHAGTSGAHVNGWEQHLYFSRMISTSDPHTSLYNLSSVVLENYLENMRTEIKSSELLVDLDPREPNLLPEGRPGPFVVFVRSGTRNDEYLSFRIFMMSLRTYFWDLREIFRGVMRFRIQGRLLYIVGCPLSQLFCQYNPRGVQIIGPTRKLYEEVQRQNDLYEKSLYELISRTRVPDPDPAKEAQLLNLIT